jgi:hypothetical protein
MTSRHALLRKLVKAMRFRLFEGPSRRAQRRHRRGKTIAFEVTQNESRVDIQGDGIDIYFAAEGDIAFPSKIDPSFSVWALLPKAMEDGFDIHIKQPIDPKVAANAELLSQVWEMWVPDLYRSVKVRGQGEWTRIPRNRLPLVQLFSGGVDSTFSILKNRNVKSRGFVVTLSRFDKVKLKNFAGLIAQTDSLLGHLNYDRLLITNNVRHRNFSFTHAITLASCLFFLSDLFDEGTIAADSTYQSEFAIWPWGNNHFTNGFFTGSDFAVRTVGSEAGRTEKIAAIAEAGVDLECLSFCREQSVIPSNCGICDKCITTKAMFLIATGGIPEIFIDNSFDEGSLRKLLDKRSERVDVFNMYFYAKRHGLLDRIESLADVVEEGRNRGRRQWIFG